MKHTSKRRFARCRELRENKGLSQTKLAAGAGVGRDLLRTLEEGNWHTAPKVMAVFEALQREYGDSLQVTDEIEHYADAGDEMDGTGSEAHD